ncbi:VOC family protein [Phenylobacterium soli]|uniref:VOC family protein n=1 Tax=Phenylobacterium soli TaxID=2170551 RepID=A0A328AFD8_9CAUL|nr:VOC family protein [Phenylobacterium soli]RAK53245.1 VOC family protein [Phenylobacterium soli]
MLDHVSLKVADFTRSAAFYDAALQPLGLRRLMGDGQNYTGYGDDRPFFWIGRGGDPGSGAHVAFVAKDRKTVDAFYAAAIAAGGRDNGGPGIRAHYHPTYYGAFVLDPDGHNVEAVCHAPA